MKREIANRMSRNPETSTQNNVLTPTLKFSIPKSAMPIRMRAKAWKLEKENSSTTQSYCSNNFYKHKEANGIDRLNELRTHSNVERKKEQHNGNAKKEMNADNNVNAGTHCLKIPSDISIKGKDNILQGSRPDYMTSNTWRDECPRNDTATCMSGVEKKNSVDRTNSENVHSAKKDAPLVTNLQASDISEITNIKKEEIEHGKNNVCRTDGASEKKQWCDFKSGDPKPLSVESIKPNVPIDNIVESVREKAVERHVKKAHNSENNIVSSDTKSTKNDALKIQETKPDDYEQTLSQVSCQKPKNLLIYHSIDLPLNVRHVLSSIYPDNFCRQKVEYAESCNCFQRGRSSMCNDLDCILFACQEECRSNCPAGPLCQNRRLTSMKWKMVEVFDAKRKGRGLRALEKLYRGDLVTEYVGVVTPRRMLEKAFQEYENQQMLYIMALDNHIYIDARTTGGVARYINHGCDPNCRVDRWKVRGITRAGVFALRDIEVGEELCFDYQWERRLGRSPTKCHCMASICRGTLEISKDGDLDDEISRPLPGYWKKPIKGKGVKHEIVNRVIKVYFEGNHEYYIADVRDFDPETKLHKVLYKTDEEESWENLDEVEWMILEEGAEYSTIKRRVRKDDVHNCTQVQMNEKLKHENFIMVQTRVREELYSKHVIEKCQRYFRVQVTIIRCSNSTKEYEDESTGKKNPEAGLVWKLTVDGMDPCKALIYLKKNIEMIKLKLRILSKRVTVTRDPSLNDKIDIGNSGMASHAQLPLPQAIPSSELDKEDELISKEIAIPYFTIDSMKKELLSIRDKCKNVMIGFIYTSALSKEVTRLKVTASHLHDLKKALHVIWYEAIRIKNELGFNVPAVGATTQPKDICFFAGHLSAEKWLKFSTYRNIIGYFDYTKKFESTMLNTNVLKDFQKLHKCSIWIDLGNAAHVTDQINHLTEENSTTDSINVYLGCEPDRVDSVWKQINDRIYDIEQGVKFIKIGDSSVFHKLITENMKCCTQISEHVSQRVTFFEFVNLITGVKITVDPLTNTYIRMDGEQAVCAEDKGGEAHEKTLKDNINYSFNSSSKKSVERIQLAEKMLQLQLYIYADDIDRRRRWIFGRDWTVMNNTAQQKLFTKQKDHSLSISSISLSQFSSAYGFDARTISKACNEISSIVSMLSMHPIVGAHAVLILYRFMHVARSKSATVQTDIRDLVMACVFLANKSQKIVKWKRLELVLIAAYDVIYSISNLDIEGEEARRLESRVLSTEKIILQTLNYDIFWTGIDWIVSSTSTFISPKVSKKALAISLSWPILAAGPTLWLGYGPLYIFITFVGLMESECIPQLIQCLQLDATKLKNVINFLPKFLDTVIRNMNGIPSKLMAMLLSLKNKLDSSLPYIQSLCAIPQGTIKDPEKWHNIIQKNSMLKFLYGYGQSKTYERVIRGVDSVVVTNHILPSLRNLTSECNCEIFVEELTVSYTRRENIVLEGSWRSICCAELKIYAMIMNHQQVRDESDAGRIGDKWCQVNSMIRCSSPQLSSKSTPQLVYSSPSSLSNNSTCSFTKPNAFTQEIHLQNTTNFKVEGRKFPAILNTKYLGVSEQIWKSKGTDSTSSELTDLIESKANLQGYIEDNHLFETGLSWWRPSCLASTKKRAFTDFFLAWERYHRPEATFDMTLTQVSKTLGYEEIADDYCEDGEMVDEDHSDLNEQKLPTTNISFQRWPSKKVEYREREKIESFHTGHARKVDMGFSAAALQEMQLLYQIHNQIPSSRGHQNFILPVSIAIPFSGKKRNESELDQFHDEAHPSSQGIMSAKYSSKKTFMYQQKNFSESLFLVFERTPISLHKLLSRSKRRHHALEESWITPTLFVSWFYDITSALAYLHVNNIVLRTVHPEQMLFNMVGEAKLSNLSRTIVIPHEDRGKIINPLSHLRDSLESEELFNTPYMSPEMLLGSTRYTKETDVWTIACLMAHLLLNKPLFSGEDRYSHTTSIFKVVGTPSEKNYFDATLFPNYELCKPSKSYKKGVEKALKYHLKGRCEHQIKEYDEAINLLSCMLDLDPKKRITAEEALAHKCMTNYQSNYKTHRFRQQFAQEWLHIRRKWIDDCKDENIDERRKRSLNGGELGKCEEYRKIDESKSHNVRKRQKTWDKNSL